MFRAYCSIIIVYSLAIAPGCRSLGSKSQLLEDNLSSQSAKAAKVQEGLSEQGHQLNAKGFTKLLNLSSEGFEFFAQPEYGSIQQLTAYQMRNFSLATPPLDQSGMAYREFYVAPKAQDSSQLLGIDIQLDHDKKEIRLVLSEYHLQRIFAKYQTRDLKNLRKSQVTKFVTGRDAFRIAMYAKNKDQVRTFTVLQSQKLRSFFAKVESKRTEQPKVEQPSQPVEPQLKQEPQIEQTPSVESETPISTTEDENKEQIEIEKQVDETPEIQNSSEPLIVTVAQAQEAIVNETQTTEVIEKPTSPKVQQEKPQLVFGPVTLTKVFLALSFVALGAYLISWSIMLSKIMSNIPKSFFGLNAAKLGSIGLIALISSLVLVCLANIFDYIIGRDSYNKLIFRWPKYLI